MGGAEGGWGLGQGVGLEPQFTGERRPCCTCGSRLNLERGELEVVGP